MCVFFNHYLIIKFSRVLGENIDQPISHSQWSESSGMNFGQNKVYACAKGKSQSIFLS